MSYTSNAATKCSPMTYLNRLTECENLTKIAREMATIARREIGRVVDGNTADKQSFSDDLKFAALEQEFQANLVRLQSLK
jgi:hypothetical protein